MVLRKPIQSKKLAETHAHIFNHTPPIEHQARVYIEYTHEHLLISCYRTGYEISQVSRSRFTSVSKRFCVQHTSVENHESNQTLLCPQSPPNRFLGTPLYPSPKATAWVLHLLTMFIVRQRGRASYFISQGKEIIIHSVAYLSS